MKINFGVSTYKQKAPFVQPEETIIDVPHSGDLPSQPQDADADYELDLIIQRITLTQESTDSMSSRHIYLDWINPREEWIAIYYHTWCEDIMYGWDDSISGPFAITDNQASKILEVYGLTEEHVPLKDVAHTAPYELAQLRRKKIE